MAKQDTTVMTVQLVANTQDFNEKLKGVANTAKGAGRDISASLAFDNTASLRKITQVGEAVKTLKNDLKNLRDRTIKIDLQSNINKTMIDNLRAFKTVAKDFPASFTRTYKIKTDIDIKQLKELQNYLPTLRALGRINSKVIKISTQVDKKSLNEATKVATDIQKEIQKASRPKRLTAGSDPTTVFNLPEKSRSTEVEERRDFSRKLERLRSYHAEETKIVDQAEAKKNKIVQNADRTRNRNSQQAQKERETQLYRELDKAAKETTVLNPNNKVKAIRTPEGDVRRSAENLAKIRRETDAILSFGNTELVKSIKNTLDATDRSISNFDKAYDRVKNGSKFRQKVEALRNYSYEPDPESLAGRFMSGYRQTLNERNAAKQQAAPDTQKLKDSVLKAKNSLTGFLDNSKFVKGLQDLGNNFEITGKKGEGMFGRFFRASFFADILADSIFNVVGSMKDALTQTVLYAARTQELEVVLESLAKVNDISNKTILAQEVGIKRLNITTQDTRETIARFINVGFDLNKASPLARVAQDLAVIGGKSTSEELNQLTIAIQTLQSRNLRSAGVFLTVDEILDKLAATSGRARDSFSTLEKQQAVLNAVLEYGSKVAGTYDAAMGTASKQMRSLERHFREAQNAIGEAFVPALGDGVKVVESLLISVAKYPDAFLGMATSIGIATAALVAFKTQAVAGLAGSAVRSVAGVNDLAIKIARPFGGTGVTRKEELRSRELGDLETILREKEALHEASSKKLFAIQQRQEERTREVKRINDELINSKGRIQDKEKELASLDKENKLTDAQIQKKRDLVNIIGTERSRRELLQAELTDARRDLKNVKDDPRVANLQANISRREREIAEAERNLSAKRASNRLDDFSNAAGNIALIGAVVATIVTAGGAIQEIANALETLKPVDLSLNEKLSNDLFNNMVNQSNLQAIINGQMTDALEIKSAEEKFTRELSVESLISLRVRERENGVLLTGLELNKARLEVAEAENQKIRERQKDQRNLAQAEIKASFTNLQTLQDRLKVISDAKKISDSFIRAEGITKKDNGTFGKVTEGIIDSLISNPLKRGIGYTDEDIAASLIGAEGHNASFRGVAYRANQKITDQYVASGKAVLKADEEVRKSVEDTLKVLEFQNLRTTDSKQLARDAGVFDMEKGFSELVEIIEKVRQSLLKISSEKYEIAVGVKGLEEVGKDITKDLVTSVEGAVNKAVVDQRNKFLRENLKGVPLTLQQNGASILNPVSSPTTFGFASTPQLTAEQTEQLKKLADNTRFETQLSTFKGETGEQFKSRFIAGATGDVLKQLREGANFSDVTGVDSLTKILLGRKETALVDDGSGNQAQFQFDGNYFREAQKTALQNKAITERLESIYEEFFGGREIRYADAVQKAKIDLEDAINPNKQLDLINKQIELANAQNRLGDLRNGSQETDRYEVLLKVTNAQIKLEEAKAAQRDVKDPELYRLATQTKIVELETQLFELRRGTDPTVERLERQLKIEQNIKNFKDQQKDIEDEIATLKVTSTLPAISAELLAQRSILTTIQERRQAEQQLTADIAVEIDKRTRYNLNSAKEIDRIVGEVFLERQRGEREGQESLLKSIVNLEYSRGNTELFANNPAIKEAMKQSEELEKMNREGGVQTLILNRTNEILEQKVASNIDIGNRLTEASNQKIDSIGNTLATGLNSVVTAIGQIQSMGLMSGTSEGSGLTPNETAKMALQFFIGKGWTKEQSAGIVGNLQTESGNFAPDVISGQRRGDGGKAVGAAQWHPDRQARFAGIYGRSLIGSSIMQQLDFVDRELKGSESLAGNALRKARTVEQAATIVDKLYERSAGLHTGQRIANAKNLLGVKVEVPKTTSANVPEVNTSASVIQYLSDQTTNLDALKKEANKSTGSEKDKALKALNDYRKKIEDAERRSREILIERLAQITGSNKALQDFTLIETQAAQEIVSILENNEQAKANQIQKYREINAKEIGIIERQNELDKYANERSEEKFFGKDRRSTQSEILFGKTSDLINRSGEFYDKLIGEEDIARIQRFSDSITETIKLESEASDRRNQSSLYRATIEQNFYNEQEKNRQDLEDREIQFELKRMSRGDSKSQLTLNTIREEILVRNEAREALESEIDAQMRFNETFLGSATQVRDLQREALRDRLKEHADTITEILKLENGLSDRQEGLLERLRLKQAQVNQARRDELETSLSNQIELESRIAGQNDPLDRTGIAQQREKLLGVIAEVKSVSDSTGDFFADSFKGIQDGFGGLVDKMTEKLGIFGQAYGNFIKSTINRVLSPIFQDITDKLFPRDSALGDAAGLLIGNNSNPNDSISSEVSARSQSIQALDVFTNALYGATQAISTVFTGSGGIADNAQYFGSTLLGAGNGFGSIVNHLGGVINSGGRGSSFAPKFNSPVLSRMISGDNRPQTFSGTASNILDIPSGRINGNVSAPLGGLGVTRTGQGGGISGTNGIARQGGLAGILARNPKLSGMANNALLAAPALGASLGGMLGGSSTTGGILGQAGGLLGGVAGIGLASALTGGALGGSLFGAGTALGGIFGGGGALAIGGLSAAMSATVVLAPIAGAFLIGSYLFGRAKRRREEKKKVNELSGDALKQLQALLTQVKSDKIDGQSAITQADEIRQQFMKETAQLKTKPGKALAKQQLAQMDSIIGQIKSAAGQQKTRQETNLAIVPTYAQGGVSDSNLIRVSRGEKLIYPTATGNRSYKIGGAFDAKDNILMRVPVGTVIQNPVQQHRASIRGYASGSDGVGVSNYKVAPVVVNAPPVTVINVMSDEEAQRLAAKIPNAIIHGKVRAQEHQDGTLRQDMLEGSGGRTY